MKQDFASVVNQIYAAIDSGAEWDSVLHAVCGFVGAGSGCIVSSSEQTDLGSVGSFHGIDPEWIDAYNQRYCAYDPTPSLLRSQPGRVHVDHVTGPNPGELEGNARVFYNEVMRPQDFRHTLHLGFQVENGRDGSIVLQRSARHGPFSEQAVSALAALGAHLERALSLYARLHNTDCLNEGLAAALDRIRFGVILLDARGCIRHMSAKAEALLQSTRALYLTPEGLVARCGDENRALQTLIGQALAPVNEHPTTALRLNNRDGWPCLYLQATPLSMLLDGHLRGPSPVKAAIWVSTQESNRVCEATLRALYDLTTAESQTLARLVEGNTLDEISELRAVDRETVRSQVKSARHKLGVSRQADLVRIVLSGPAGLLAHASVISSSK